MLKPPFRVVTIARVIEPADPEATAFLCSSPAGLNRSIVALDAAPRGSVLVDRCGHVLAQKGQCPSHDLTWLAALCDALPLPEPAKMRTCPTDQPPST